MIRGYGVIRQSARRIGIAASRVTRDIQERHAQQEPHITDRMLGRIAEAMNDFEIKGIRWTAMTLTDRGPNSQESQYGADFMGVLNITLPSFQVNKGFLAQAKRIDPDHLMSRNELRRLHSQCDKMLRLSPDSFVFLYSPDGVTVVPAVSIIGSSTDPTALYFRTVTRFFEEHFESFIGDQRISLPQPELFKQLGAEYGVGAALFLQAAPSEAERNR